MAGIVQGIPSGVPTPDVLGSAAIPIEATAARELRVKTPTTVEERIEGLLEDVLNELVILNNRMFQGVNLDSERVKR